MKLLFRIAALGLTLLSFPALAADPIIVKFSHVNPPNSPKAMAVEFFKKLAEERTQKRVTVEHYPNSTLFKDKEEIEALQLGAVQMLAPTVGKFGPLGARQFEVFDLPYMFDNFDEVHRVTAGPIGQALMAQLEPKGIKGLAFWDNGFKNMNANRPLIVPSDFDGIKMRIFSSKVLDSQMRALGAIPQVLAASEIYQSLHTGLVDGGENTLSTFSNFKLYEVQKHLTISNHGYVAYGVVVNKKFWDELPADIRSTLQTAMDEATVFANKISEDENLAALEYIRNTGKTEVHVITSAQKSEWKKALVKVHQEREATVGKDLIEAIYKATGFDPARP